MGGEMPQRRDGGRPDTISRDPLLGQLLDGRYRIEGRIARGGMAAVYTATDTRLERTVAIKVMHSALADDDEFVRRFIREAKATARLSHPNVVSVFDQGEDGDAVFLVMEYVDGHTLRDLLKARGPLSPAAALAVLQPVLAALAAAHDAGLVHRDVKPENVLIADDGRVKVADFGLARAIAASTLSHSSVIIGTVAYLAPEQVERGIADARADVYGAGVMLYEMLVGGVPFRADTPLAVAYRHVHEQVPQPSSAVAGIPADVDRLVAHATARDPGQRPGDAGDLLVETARVRDRLGPHAPVPRLGDQPAGGGSASTCLLARETSDTLVTPLPAAAGAPVDTAGSRGDDGSGPSGRPARRRRRWPYVLAVLVLVAAGAGVAGWWYAAGQWVSVPRITHLTAAQAKHRLDLRDLDFAAKDRHSDTVRKGLVITQDPNPAADIRRGRAVTAFVSTGPRMVTVPDVSGQRLKAARATLSEADLHVAAQVHNKYSDSIDDGAVIRTKPADGSTVRHDSDVTVIVSKGRTPVAVPSVVGKSVDDARTLLSTAGFTVGVADAIYSDKHAKGTVAGQSPYNTKAQPGTKVTITPSKGPHLYPVPDVTSEPVKKAVAELKAAGFHPTVTDFFGSSTVTGQRPAAGFKARKGITVRLLR